MDTFIKASLATMVFLFVGLLQKVYDLQRRIEALEDDK